MKYDTDLGPVWVVPDMLGEKVAKQEARIYLMWPDLEGFTAMHMGPSPGGAWVVRAPREALAARHFPLASAAEYPVAEGTVWPPVTVPTDEELLATWENVAGTLKVEYHKRSVLFGEEIADTWLKEQLRDA